MNILECKSAVVYKYSRNAKKVATYSEEWITIQCSIQPTSTSDWLEWEAVFNTYKLYSSYLDIWVWDKIVALWKTFIVNATQQWNWIKRKYVKAFINESIWNS